MVMPEPATTRRLSIGARLIVLTVLVILPQLYTADNENLNRVQVLNSLADFLLLLTLASSWNLFSGSTGLIDLGHTVFLGLGAYSVAVVMYHFIVPFPAAVIWTAVIGLVYALGVGAILVRLRGGYFAIATFALLVLVRGLVALARPVTGGGIGLVVPLAYNATLYYYAALFCLIVVLAIIFLIHRSALRMLLGAIRQDSAAASVRGIPVRNYWLLTYVIAGICSTVVGSIWFYRHNAIDPASVFIEVQSFELVVIVFVGGLGTIYGPIIGGLLIYVAFGGLSAEWRFIIEGIVLLIVIAYVPSGIIGFWHSQIQPRFARGTTHNEP